jgi:hypothetical protein
MPTIHASFNPESKLLLVTKQTNIYPIEEINSCQMVVSSAESNKIK